MWSKIRFEPLRDKTNKMACAPSEDSDQPGHPPRLIRVFAIRTKKAQVLSYPLNAQRRLRSDWTDAQADLSLRWAHMPFCWFCHEATHLNFYINLHVDIHKVLIIQQYGCFGQIDGLNEDATKAGLLAGKIDYWRNYCFNYTYAKQKSGLAYLRIS